MPDIVKLPIEICQVIISYFNECPDYMHARRIDRNFRYACQNNKLEVKFARIINEQFSEHYTFTQIVANDPGLLWFRFIKEPLFDHCDGLLKVDDDTYLVTEEDFPTRRDDTGIWGFAINAAYIHEYGLCQSCFHKGLIIVRRSKNDNGGSALPSEPVFMTDISIPENKDYIATCDRSWVEYEEKAHIPFKYITFPYTQSTNTGQPGIDSPLICMVDAWHNKRLSIDLTWDEVCGKGVDSFFDLRFIAVTFSKFGILLITCWKNPTKVFVVGRPQYLGLREQEIDMSQLFDYFYYVITDGLGTLVDLGHEYDRHDNRTVFDGPEYYPLIRNGWFGNRNMFFQVTPQAQKGVPTYEEFVTWRKKDLSIQDGNQTRQMSLSLNVKKHKGGSIIPDQKIFLRGITMGATFHDNMFIFCTSRQPNFCGVIDIRPSSFDLVVTNKKVKVLKVRKDIIGYVDDCMVYARKKDNEYFYLKLDVASLLYNR